MKYTDLQKGDTLIREPGSSWKEEVESVTHDTIITGCIRVQLKSIQLGSSLTVYFDKKDDIPDTFKLFRNGIAVDLKSKEVLENLQLASLMTLELRQRGTLDRLHSTALWMNKHGFSARLKVTQPEYDLIQKLLRLKSIPNPENPKFLGFELMVVKKDGEKEQESQKESERKPPRERTL